ncbi:MAG: transposase [Mycobacterium sp.]|uniref:IS110 family transposase n=1 Tax=Mycobacterium sp. TaxID=1785 RepID=UPI003899C842
MALTLGIDVAVRAAHQATLARDGKTVWRGRKFLTRPDELERVWVDVGAEDPAELTVVLEPTRNAWIVIAEWFRRRGAKVVMVPTTQSADLRKYYSKHAKNDRIESELLARLPLLHPEGLSLHRARPSGSVAAADQAALHDGQAPHRGLCPPRLPHRAAGTGLVCGARVELRQRSAAVSGALRRSSRSDPARPGPAGQVPHRPLGWRLA